MSNLARLTVLFFVFISLLPFRSHAQWSLSQINLAHQYNPGNEIDLMAQIVRKKDSTHTYLALNIIDEEAQLYDYGFDLFLVNSVEEKLNAPLPKALIDSTYLYSYANEHNFKLSLPSTQKKILVVKVKSYFSNFNFFYSFSLSSLNTTGFMLYYGKQPYINKYFQKQFYSSPDTLHGYFYQHTFSPAIPPMVTRRDLPEKSIEIDSSFMIPAGQLFQLDRSGLYFFQKDTTKVNGKGFRLEHRYFPEPATLSQLKEPLIYLLTKKERDHLEKINDKKSFDKFWLDMTRSADKAKKIIKAYYNRVEQANIYFTTFKAGWKSDPGMIYIIFGPPDQVFKTETGEEWIYLANDKFPKIRFRFIKSENIFSPSHYALIRDQGYQEVWFRAIDLWRKSRF